MAVANFDVVPHEMINKSIFKFADFIKPTDVRFSNLGFETYNFTLNSGTTLWLICFWALASAAIAIINKFCKPKKPLLVRVMQYCSNSLFFSMIIRILLECYLELIISSYLNLQTLDWSANGEIFGSVVSMMQVAFLITLPVSFNYFLTVRRRLLDDPIFMAKYGESY